MLQQEINQLEASPNHRIRECAFPIPVDPVHVGARLKQQARVRLSASGRSAHERSLSPFIHEFGSGAMLEQCFDESRSASVVSGQRQRTFPIQAADVWIGPNGQSRTKFV
jgi:hypothetical protein